MLAAAVLWPSGPWVRPHAGASNPTKTIVNPGPASTLGPASDTFKTAVSIRPYADDLATVRQMAEQGDPAAQFALGTRYAIGEEVREDDSEAARWFSDAAQQGHTEAQAILGVYYMLGRGVPQDLDKAYFWSILAQAGGDAGSKYRVKVLTSRITPSRIRAAEEQANAWLRQRQALAAKPGTG
jgi:TPR repeat protein